MLFLTEWEWDGLYLDGGTRYGYVFKLAPAHVLYYRWLVKGDDVVNEGWGWNERMSLDELRELVSGPDFGSAEDGLAPDDRIHPQDTSPPGHDG